MNLTHHFLLSMPQMQDAHFAQSLTYICEHDERGALGVVINRTLEMNFGDILTQMDIVLDNPKIGHREVYDGGPIEPTHGLILHRTAEEQSWLGTHSFGQGICISSSRDILEDIAKGRGPREFLIALGYAGWAAGQLEDELANNAWLTCPADPNIIFSNASKSKLDQAANILGINLSQLSSETGHA